VAENIELRLASTSPWRKITRRTQLEKAGRLLEQIGADVDPEALVQELSMPEQQLVEIACALGTNAKILILDEPTASLT